MATNEVVRGPVSDYVKENVERLRAAKRWSLADLSEEMSKAGRPLRPSGLHRLEQGSRRVDVDDLMALALAFGVSPSELVLPQIENGGQVHLTAGVSMSEDAARRWLSAGPDTATEATISRMINDALGGYRCHCGEPLSSSAHTGTRPGPTEPVIS